MTKPERRRGVVVVMLVLYVPALAAAVGAWVGRHDDATVRDAAIGGAAALVVGTAALASWALVVGLVRLRR